ncbi:TonB-dependent receptor family protein [Chitinophaga deserti]|uniref:TonB-dependent receptor family protein n=1 Tax=Chitinophaga deserti TaxID=2164099 RepID=UPI000D6BA63B|nr:TonB-dependent receptor [Chitinophaga deserti]
MKRRMIIAAMGLSLTAAAQSDTTTLQGITVQGYAQQRDLSTIPGAVSVVRGQDLQRFGPASLVPALNAAPGVRMEERSPGSYRLNIRGSSLRSPFGVRNVKMYYHGLPFTDPGGNTYLNQFSPAVFTSLEVLKGPGSSLYGASTGGVLLGDRPFENTNSLSAGYTAGSYGSHLATVSGTFGTARFRQQAVLSWQESGGYRDHTYMRRYVAGWSGRYTASEHSAIEAHVLAGDLFYETPGGLNLTQFLANPRQARPAAGAFPSAQGAHAAIYQQTVWTGIKWEYRWNEHWEHSAGVYGAWSGLRNPSIRNYEKRNEPHAGARTMVTWKKGPWRVLAGAEAQTGNFRTRVSANSNGMAGILQTDDRIRNGLLSLFMQSEAVLDGGWVLTAGLSMNGARTVIRRVSETPVFRFASSYDKEWAPRFAVLKQFSNWASVYGVVSKGFSPPAVAELLPSTSVINTDLQAEKGWNYEAGARGGNSRFRYDVSLFRFQLKDAIVGRRDASGADYFVNAGATVQQGAEVSAMYQPAAFLGLRAAWTFHHFRYDSFSQQDKSFDGNRLPGTPQHALAASADVRLSSSFSLFATWQYNDDIFLNDANTDKSAAFNLLGLKAEYKVRRKGWEGRLFAGAENLLDETYSLGNDINAAAGRYYNAAPGRSIYAGFAVQLGK